MINNKLVEEEFKFLGNNIHLNVSQVAMPPKRVQEAYGSFMDKYVKSLGEGIVDEAWNIVNECRPKLQKLINAKSSHEIGFVKNTAEGMGILASGLKLSPGDSIVIADQEHQSTLFPWINAHQLRGIRLNVVKSRDHEVNEDDMISAIDEKTRVLVVSSAQFSTGYRIDLTKLGDACHKRNIIFAVDGIQTLGRFTMDVQRDHIDYLVAGSNKGLLGSLGCGFVYCSDRIINDITPPYAGYQSTENHVAAPSVTSNFEYLEWHPNARKFESGNLSYNCILALSKGVDLLLELGMDNIETQVRALEKRLRDNISNLTLPVVQAKDPIHWGGIVCVYYPKEHEDIVIETMSKYRIHGTMRGGYIRFGVDFYNTLEQMDIVSKALYEIEEKTKTGIKQENKT